jgi:pimeloyl-ACP methyl ester carboxylesterase
MYTPKGAAFQMAAILSDGDRTAELAGVQCPALVIHGRVDPLVGLSGGEATAAAIPGAELLVLDEMGHDVPVPLVPEIVAAIAKNAARA